ncbi:MAG: TVP38/TMEM64 family protein [Alphaproteobacteria bacterium]
MLDFRNDAKDLTVPAMPDESTRQGGTRRSPLRFLPIAVLVLGLAIFLALGLDHTWWFETLRNHRGDIIGWVAGNRQLAAVIFVFGYIAMVAFSLPGATFATMFGGFAFGTAPAVVLVVISATVGAVILFVAARTAFADVLHARARPNLERMEQGFRENALSYLLFLRLVPIFPFFLVNLVPAFLGVSLRTYVVGTFLGIIPGTILYARLGGGIGELLDTGETPDLDIVLEPRFLLPLLAFGVLALVPVFYKAIKSRKS